MLNLKHIDLKKRWITKPLHKDSFTKVVSSGNPHIMHRLYMLTNELENRQEFLELKEHDKINISAVITTKPGYAKDARNQAEILKWMHPYITQRPEFSVKLYLYDKTTMLELFSFKHTTTNEKEVYRLIDKLKEKVINII